MNFEQLLQLAGDEPVFETGLLLAGDVNPGYLRRQLSGWVNAGKLFQLRRGLYALAPPYARVDAHPFVVANRLVPGSVVSLQTALAYYDLIPEYVPAITSVTARRAAEWQNPLGDYLFRRIQPDLLFGYESIPVDGDQSAYVAYPEKALLDLVYLTPGGDNRRYLDSLRLQNLDRLDLPRLHEFATRFDRPRMLRAAEQIAEIAAIEESEYEAL
jgi:predicted transcriptional regulator of viral defense system